MTRPSLSFKKTSLGERGDRRGRAGRGQSGQGCRVAGWGALGGKEGVGRAGQGGGVSDGLSDDRDMMMSLAACRLRV